MWRDAVMRPEIAGGAQHEVAVADSGERRRFRPRYLKRQPGGR
jgi:hypothetical protein